MSIGFWQLLMLAVYVAVWIVPFWKIFPRAGWPSALSILMVIPLLNLALIWVLAFKRWPGDA